jgi:hypothetical protein
MKHLNAEQQRWLMRIILKGKSTGTFKFPP